MSVLKVIEVMAESSKSWEDAAQQAILKASSTIDNIHSAWVKDKSVRVEDGEIVGYRVTMKLSFGIK